MIPRQSFFDSCNESGSDTLPIIAQSTIAFKIKLHFYNFEHYCTIFFLHLTHGEYY